MHGEGSNLQAGLDNICRVGAPSRKGSASSRARGNAPARQLPYIPHLHSTARLNGAAQQGTTQGCHFDINCMYISCIC